MPSSEIDKDSTADNSKHLYCFRYKSRDEKKKGQNKFQPGVLEIGGCPSRKMILIFASLDGVFFFYDYGNDFNQSSLHNNKKKMNKNKK